MLRVEIKEVQSRQMLNTFIHLPYRLYKGHTGWVPPLFADEKAFYDFSKNPGSRNSDTALWLAYKRKTVAGRIMGIIHHGYNQLHGLNQARFYAFDCIDSRDVADALLHCVEHWAAKYNAAELIGPFGFSEKDPQGLRIEGFEYPAVIATASHPPYLPGLISEYGFEKFIDCLVYKLPVPNAIPPFYERIYNRLSARGKLKSISFTNRRQLKPYIQPVFELVNKTYAGLYGFIPMTDAEVDQLAKKYLPLLDPELVKLVTDESGKTVAFVIAMPDLSNGLLRCNGRLFPLGWYHLLKSMKQTKQLNLLLGAVAPAYQGRGLTTMLGISLLMTARKRNFELIDSHLVLESNLPMRGELEKLNGQIYKRYRIYRKSLLQHS